MTISLKPKKLNIEKDENYISGETEVEDEFSNHTKTLWLDMSWIHRFLFQLTTKNRKTCSARFLHVCKQAPCYLLLFLYPFFYPCLYPPRLVNVISSSFHLIFNHHTPYHFLSCLYPPRLGKVISSSFYLILPHLKIPSFTEVRRYHIPLPSHQYSS